MDIRDFKLLEALKSTILILVLEFFNLHGHGFPATATGSVDRANVYPT